jgi:hypothetical protein
MIAVRAVGSLRSRLLTPDSAGDLSPILARSVWAGVSGGNGVRGASSQSG